MRYGLSIAILFSGTLAYSQTDIDAIRFSRPGLGGSSRVLAMGGAFGAVGADLSVGAINPGALALYRQGEIAFSGGLKFTTNTGRMHGNANSVTDAAFVFNNFGIALAWAADKDAESRHVISFANVQHTNFLNSTRLQAQTRESIVKDMLALSNQAGAVDRMDDMYERMGFETFVIDSMYGKFIPMLDIGRSVEQTRDIVTTGRMNELNFSYAYAYKDKYYIGASLGIPRVEYNYQMIHEEVDERDSMRIHFNPDNTWTHTYSYDLPELNDYYLDRGGFNSLSYAQYFRTSGSGINLKFGAVARVNDELRLGIYYHTPSLLQLTDVYANEMSTTWDLNRSRTDTDAFPQPEGFFEYRVTTPGRVGLNAAYLFGKSGLISFDYETINYTSAQLRGERISDFAEANNRLKRSYSHGHSVKIGGELNLSPVMLRAGYAMFGSPYGHVFTGDLVRHHVTFGAGFRVGNSLYFDFAVVQAMSRETFQPFTTLETIGTINYRSTMLSLTGGFKF